MSSRSVYLTSTLSPSRTLSSFLVYGTPLRMISDMTKVLPAERCSSSFCSSRVNIPSVVPRISIWSDKRPALLQKSSARSDRHLVTSICPKPLHSNESTSLVVATHISPSADCIRLVMHWDSSPLTRSALRRFPVSISRT